MDIATDQADVLTGFHWLTHVVNFASVSALLCGLTYLYFRHKFGYWRRRGLNNPVPLPWFGTTLHPVFRSKPELELIHHKQYGKLYGLYDGFLGTNPTLVCGHPEAIKQVTIKHFDSFTNRRKPATWKSIRYRALTYMRDDEWKHMRKVLAPVFTSNKLKKMFELMKKCTSNLSNFVAIQEGEIDLKRLFSVFTVDIISTCCFSMDLKDYRHPESPLLLNARKFFNVSRLKMAIYAATPKQLLALFKSDINDISSIEFFERFATEIINTRRKMKNSTKVPEDFLQTLIEAASEFNDRKSKTTPKTSTSTTNTTKSQQDVCDDEGDKKQQSADYKQHSQQQQSSKQTLNEQQLGDLEILAQCMLFFAVGHETTATLLSSCGYFLALYPELQDRLYNEIHGAIANSNGDITYDKLMDLPYLDAFICEALRYFTPTLTFDREASEDVEIEIDSFKMIIPKGMGVVIPFLAVHHDPDNYELPEVFDPERFMPENKHKIKPCTFIPFGSGPRHCLASRFALLEAKLALATLIDKFTFTKSPGTVWPPTYRHHYMLLQMEWPKIEFVDRKTASFGASCQAQIAA